MQKYIRHLQFLPLVLLLVCSLTAGAQTITGGVTGIVTDTSGAVVPNAKVSATNVDTGVETATTTNSDGVYNLRFLQIGKYKVTVDAPGFAANTVGPFVLETGQTVKFDAKLNLAGTESKVSVDAELVPLINTESPVLSTTLDTRAIENMPLVSRNIVALTMFLPGAIATQPNNFVGQAAVSGPISSNTTVSVNANRQQTNQYLLDGMNINQTLDDIPGYNPSVDAIGEVKVISANAPAEYGNVLGGDILYQTKSGTNQFHGSAFYFLSDANLNANTWANKRTSTPTPKTSFTRNIFGGTFGGPIFHDKLFFFGDYQGGRYHSGGLANATVLTAAMRQGDFSELLNPALMCSGDSNLAPSASVVINGVRCASYSRLIQLYDSTAPGSPAYANNKIPINNPAIQYLINNPSYYPAPNQAPQATNTPATNNYRAPSKNRNYGNQFDVKMDYRLSQKDNLSGRFSYADQGSTTTTVLPTSFSAAPLYPVRGVSLNEVHTFNSSVVNEFRAGYTRIVSVAAALLDPTGKFGLSGNSILGIPGGQPFAGFSALAFGNSASPQQIAASNGTEYSTIGTANTGSNYSLNTFLYGDNLTMLKNRHTFKVGVQFLRQQQNNFYPGNDGSMGGFYYLGAGTTNPNGGTAVSTALGTQRYSTGYTAADLLLNRAGFVSKGGVAGPVGMRSWRSAYFFQDDWKVAPNLTLTLGVRYEYVQPFYEVNNKMSTLNPDNPSVGIIVAGSSLAKSLGYNRSLVDPYFGSVMPRIGFAYSATPRFVVRGGYGLQNFMEGTGANLRMTTNLPFQSATQLNGTAATANSGGSFFTTQNGFVGSGVTSTNVFNVWNRHIKPAFIGIYNLTLEYQVNNTASVQVGYVGESGQHLVTANQRNQLASPCYVAGIAQAPATAPASCQTSNPAPFANIVGYTGTVRYTDSNAMMNYNGLQASFRQRSWHGLQYTANYTWAHAFTNSVGFYGVPGVSVQSAYANNPYNMHKEYGPSGYDVRHSINWNLVYDLPVGRGRQFGAGMPLILDEVVGGWKLGMTGIAYTGFPVTIVTTTNSQVNANSQRANHLRQLKVVNRTINNWFGTDPSATPCGLITDPNTKIQTVNDNGICAYSQTAPGTFGTAAPNSERAPGYQTYGASVTKDFTIWHEHQINFRADADNIFNSAYLSNPGNNASTASFGQITAVRSGPRNMQLSVKYHF